MTHTRRWIAAVVVVTVVVAGGAATAYARSSGAGAAHHYRTTVARLGSVQETLSTTGTVDAAHRADVEFAISGTVGRVAAKQGQRVTAGTVLGGPRPDHAACRPRAGHGHPGPGARPAGLRRGRPGAPP